MNLTHHDNRAYDLAATEARTKIRTTFEARIERGRKEGADIIQRILGQLVEDQLVDTRAMTFSNDGTDVLLRVLDQTEERKLHENAFGQFCEREDVPMSYLKKLFSEGEDGQRLAVHTMNEVAHLRPRRALIRSVKDEVRGFLSDHYRRLDGRPMFEAFALACQEIGALPIGGTTSDLRFGLRAVWPEVMEIDGDPILVGLEARNSDFGVGYQEVKTFVERLWCTNMATRQSVMKQVHLGGKLPSDISFSQKTYDFDTKCSASAVADIVKQFLNPEAVARAVKEMEIAAATKIDGKKAKALLTEKLGKGDADKALGEFSSNPYVEQLPAGPTIWRLSNAVSWVAGREKNAEKRIELEEAAGWLLDNAAKAA